MVSNGDCGYPLYWHNCYSGGFSLWSEESYSHPAKMSPALCYRILQHLQELGLIKEGDTVLDPMAGIGTTNICASAMGYPSISVELEDKFVNFQKENKEYAERRLYKPLDWTMIKGDSRRLSELLDTGNLKSVLSPPYADQVGNYSHERGDPQKYLERQERYNEKVLKEKGIKRPSVAQYSTDKNNIGNLVDKPLKSITSPPYEQSITGGKSGIEWQEEWGKPSESRQPSQDISYGDSKENIGNLKDKPLKSITSPPYEDSQGHPSLGSVNKDDWGKEGKDIVKRRGLSGEYGDAEGQVGNLKSIVSPPYGETQEGGGLAKNPPDTFRGVLKDFTQSQGDNGKNIGNLKDTPFKAITSPPYMDSANPDHTTNLEAKRLEIAKEKGISPDKVSHLDYTKDTESESYGETEGQIGRLKDKPLKSITSPPYGIDKTSGGLNTKPPRNEKDQAGRNPNSPSQQGGKEGYGETTGQIGTLKDKPLKSIVSPPYGETGVGDWKTGRAEFQEWVINEIKTKGYVEWQGKRYTEAEWRAMNHGRIDGRTTKGVHKHPTDGYSDNPENIGGLADKPLKSIVSPPYGDAEKRDRSKEASNESEKGYPRGDHNISAGYQGSDENIGKLAYKRGLQSSGDYVRIDTINLLGETGCLESLISAQIVVDPLGVDAVESVISETPIKLSTAQNAIERFLKRYGVERICKENKTRIGKAETLGGGVMAGEIYIIKLKNGMSILAVYVGQQEVKQKLWFIISSPGKIAGLLRLITSLHSANRVIIKPTDWGLGDIPFIVKSVAGNMKVALLEMEPVPPNVGQSLIPQSTIAGKLNTPIMLDPNSYLGSMYQVYSEIARVSDCLTVVVKNPTRNGKIRRLDSDTIFILEQSGWKIHCQHRALLFEELEQANMFDGTTKKVKGRLSFFKRLSWQNGNPVASWEDVLICVRK